MDSLTHIALGAAVGVAVMGRRTSPLKAAIAGAVCCTLPDLDVFIDRGDPIRNMTMHRGETHALFYITLAAPIIGWIIAKAVKEMHNVKRWILAAWLALLVHPLLDALTIYGTQLGLPFTSHPFGVGSIFIIDPLYTIPLIIGLVVVLRSPPSYNSYRWNTAGLIVSTLYLLWGFGAQQYVKGIAEKSLHNTGVESTNLLITPTAFNSVAWRVVATTEDRYGEGFYSLLNNSKQLDFHWYDKGEPIYESWRGNWNVDRMAWFTHGIFSMQERGSEVLISDLRMGQEPYYTFSFVIGKDTNGERHAVTPYVDRNRPPLSELFRHLMKRTKGETNAEAMPSIF